MRFDYTRLPYTRCYLYSSEVCIEVLRFTQAFAGVPAWRARHFPRFRLQLVPNRMTKRYENELGTHK